MRRSILLLVSAVLCVVSSAAIGGCASRRAKKSTAPDVLTPASMKKAAPVGLVVFSPKYPDLFPDGKVAMIRAPDNWEANLQLPPNEYQEPYIFMIKYATQKTIAVGLGNIAKMKKGIDLKSQVTMDHINLITSGEFESVDEIEPYKQGYKIRVELVLKKPSSDDPMDTVGYFYIMPFPGKPEIIFRGFVFGATEEGYDYMAPFEKSLETLKLVDLDF